ncbi:MAG: molecular chaperone [Cyanobacteria bacterium QS_8_64_29]|nr:MAG: molecular chaperone [Cyanobacteria bacterium QS_8_64_29]
MAIVPTRGPGAARPARNWWDPFRELDSVQQEMNRMFDDLVRTGDGGESGNLTFAPSAELDETEDAIHLKLEVPGMDPNDLDVQVSDEAISISGERRSEFQHQEGSGRRSEFRYGRFQRVIPLNARIQNDKVQASYQNGILHLNLPKAEEDKNKVVKVNVQQ